jgi:hypothetical protein
LLYAACAGEDTTALSLAVDQEAKELLATRAANAAMIGKPKVPEKKLDGSGITVIIQYCGG